MMKSESVRRYCGSILYLCLFVGLVVFCTLGIEKKGDGSETRNYGDKHYHESHDHSNDVKNGHLKGTTHSHDAAKSNTTVSTAASTTNSTTRPTSIVTTQAYKPAYRIVLKPSNSSSGRVLVKHNEYSGFVCTDGFDDNAAAVVCRELGYKKGIPYVHSSSYSYDHFTELLPSISGLNCTGSERKLKDCDGFRLGVVSNCSWFASVVCYNETPYQLRLVEGYHNNSGMVEINIGGQWGIFCAINNYDDEVADILCRNMNYTGGIISHRGEMGPSTQEKTWVPYIYCKPRTTVIKSIFGCDITLHAENILKNLVYWRNNRYINMYMSCQDKPNSHALSVQCLI